MVQQLSYTKPFLTRQLRFSKQLTCRFTGPCCMKEKENYTIPTLIKEKEPSTVKPPRKEKKKSMGIRRAADLA